RFMRSLGTGVLAPLHLATSRASERIWGTWTTPPCHDAPSRRRGRPYMSPREAIDDRLGAANVLKALGDLNARTERALRRGKVLGPQDEEPAETLAEVLAPATLQGEAARRARSARRGALGRGTNAMGPPKKEVGP